MDKTSSSSSSSSSSNSSRHYKKMYNILLDSILTKNLSLLQEFYYKNKKNKKV